MDFPKTFSGLEIIKNPTFTQTVKGYFIPSAGKHLIQSEWKEVVDFIIHELLIAYDSKITSIYLRGSVAMGRAIKGVSDIDLLVIREKSIACERQRINMLAIEASRTFTFHVKIDVYYIVPDRLNVLRDFSVLYNIYGFCVYGLEFPYSNVKPGPDCYVDFLTIKKDMDKFLHNHALADDTITKRFWLKWFCKKLLRAHVEIISTNSNMITRDLYSCYLLIKEYDFHEVLDEVFIASIDPNSNSEEYNSILCYYKIVTSKGK